MRLVNNPSRLVRLSMRPILMFILLGLQLLGNNYVAVVGFCSPGCCSRPCSCCPDLTALAQLGLSLRVQLGEKKLGLHVAREKRQALHGEMDFVR